MSEVLDPCCGSRMFYHNKKNKNVVFCDNRILKETLCDGRVLEINPDVLCDFRHLPYGDKRFSLIVFDPPHLIKAGNKSWLAKKYGKLPKNWEDYLSKGFNECWRVLKDNGTLIFKWNEQQIKKKDVLSLFNQEPLLLNKRDKTFWFVYFKGVRIDENN